MTDRPAPTPPPTATQAMAALETAAHAELRRLCAALPAAPPPVDPLLAHLAWDLGLTGDTAPAC